MYIENFKTQKEEDKIPENNSVVENNLEQVESDQKQRQSEEFDVLMQDRKIGKILHQWQAPEYESYDRDRNWYVVMTLAFIAIITYAFFTSSPIMAITFILIGMIEYIYISRKPRMIDFLITEKGVVTGRELYEFEQINSFWIFYDSHTIKALSLDIKSSLTPRMQIPLHDENPHEIRNLLIQYVPEVKQDYQLRDSFNRLLRL